jgi:DNA polymerase IV
MPEVLNLASYPRPIIHIDCDAFFTSVEQALHPELKGKPVVTGKERGIVACASYEAKALGVKRPMRLWEAKKSLPQLICLPSDYETYSLYSKRMFSIIREFTPDVEEYSIDEAFADLSGLRRIYRMGYSEIAMKIKQKIQTELGLTVSVGLSASKTLAKIASKHKKPDGFTIFRANELQKILPRITLDRVCGFGPNTEALLYKKGVHSVWDYVMRPEIWAKQLLGKIGVELWQELRGNAIYPLVTEEKTDYDTIGKTKTFTPPSFDKDFVRAQLIRNTESAFIKLRRHKLRAKTIGICLRDQEFRTWGAEAVLDRSTCSILEVVPFVNQLFDKIFKEKVLCRLTGIVLGKIEADKTVQYSLFDNVPRIESYRSVDRVIDEVNALYGKHKLHLGTSLWLGKQKQHLSERGDLPQRKMETLKGETFRQHLGIPRWDIKV